MTAPRLPGVNAQTGRGLASVRVTAESTTRAVVLRYHDLRPMHAGARQMVLRVASNRTITVRPILFVVLLAQAADSLSFAIGVSRLGIGVEGNPLMRAAHEVAGTVGVLGIKGVAIALVVTMLVVAGPRFPRFATLGSYVAIGLGFFGAFMNAGIMLLMGALG